MPRWAWPRPCSGLVPTLPVLLKRCCPLTPVCSQALENCAARRWCSCADLQGCFPGAAGVGEKAGTLTPTPPCCPRVPQGHHLASTRATRGTPHPCWPPRLLPRPFPLSLNGVRGLGEAGHLRETRALNTGCVRLKNKSGQSWKITNKYMLPLTQGTVQSGGKRMETC